MTLPQNAQLPAGYDTAPFTPAEIMAEAARRDPATVHVNDAGNVLCYSSPISHYDICSVRPQANPPQVESAFITTAIVIDAPYVAPEVNAVPEPTFNFLLAVAIVTAVILKGAHAHKTT